MENGKLILGLILLVILAYPIFGLVRAFLSLFDRGVWGKNAIPNANARIVDMRMEKVQYIKNGTKYKTKVLFSDGFTFITHKTERADGLFNYSIFISHELRDKILKKAEVTHQRAVKRYYFRKR